jgi:hypothetical protein
MAYYYKNVMDDDDDTVLADILSMKISKESKVRNKNYLIDKTKLNQL